ncbi:MAG: hypothetical protein Q8R53_05665, partial [Nanoarchaeota archaeon]|nr:hypothetical protein [Nanoarchaeota archaeon]
MKEDEHPTLSREALQKFFSFGFDPELGWVRKPNTSKVEFGGYNPVTKKHDKVIFHINERGARHNPGHEKMSTLISCYGDSFTIARQVEDNQTWAWHLSEFTKSNVINFGVGNYGLDQALLRLKREYPKNKTKIVIMGVVPSTIVRILDVWKHYNEYGNTFGFKPRFDVWGGRLQLIPNIINSEKRYYDYQDYLPEIQEKDYFYRRKFKQDILQFPYFISLLSNPLRTIPLLSLIFWHQKVKREDIKNLPYPTAMKIVMKENLKLRYALYTKDSYATTLFIKIVEEFKRYAGEQGFTPVFVLMPQKDDILVIREKGKYYETCLEQIRQVLTTIDLIDTLGAR